MSGNRTIARDAVEYVSVTVAESTGLTFNAEALEAQIGGGPWRATDAVTPTANGTATVRFLCNPAADGLGPSFPYRVRVRLVDNPETVIVTAGTVTVL